MSFDLIFFDCDSTLSAIEGVDELARLKGKEWRVSLLTQKAMDGDLDLARTALAEKRPHFESQFKSYPACLEAIIDQDPDRVVEAIHMASRDWGS